MTPKLIAEAIGTFALVLTIGLTGLQIEHTAPLAIGVVLAVMVYAMGPVSGAHFNPAVTIAVWLRGSLPAKLIAPYIAAQVVGAFVAAFLVYKFFGIPLHVTPGDGVSALKAVTAEGVFTFFLVLVILNVATVKATAANQYFGLAIGGTVMAGMYAVGAVSGAAFNPAVGIVPALFEMVIGRSVSPLLWIYAVGPVAGGVLAALVFKRMQPYE